MSLKDKFAQIDIQDKAYSTGGVVALVGAGIGFFLGGASGGGQNHEVVKTTKKGAVMRPRS